MTSYNCSINPRKNISFGHGITHIIANKDCYFDKYITGKDSVTDKFVTNNKDLFSKYFMPFMRLSRIATKEVSANSEIIPANGCKFLVTLENNEIDFLKRIYESTKDTATYLYWIPDRIVNKQSGDVINNDMQFLKTFQNFDRLENQMLSLTQRRLKQTKKHDDLVIVVGSNKDDLNAISPFSYINEEQSIENFDKIRHTKLRSAFLYDNDTPRELLDEVKELAKICNADGNIRLALINKTAQKDVPPIINAVMLLQKEYAKFSSEFRAKISKKLKNLLEGRDIPYPVERTPSTVPWEPAPDWGRIVEPDTRSIKRKIFDNIMNNKLATALILTAIGVPLYFRQTTHKKTKKV